MMFILTLLFSVFLFFNSSKETSSTLPSGIWRAVITTNGGELPFNFQTTFANGKPMIEIMNGEEKISVNEILVQDDSIFIKMPVFDSEFRVKFSNNEMIGRYLNHARTSQNIFPFKAVFNQSFRFTDQKIKPVADISGRWECDFSKRTADSSKAVGIFHQDGNELTGTFLTPTGDDRYLEGTVQDNQLFLSCFDGSHAFLFKAEIESDGTISGMYYSGNHWQEPWIAKRNDHYELPDPYSLTYLKPGYNRLDFSFPDLNGEKVSLSDDRFKNKVVIVQIMGSWCPNCMDETAFYAPLYDQYHSKGMEIVALAYEKFPDFQKAQQNLNRLISRFNIHYTVLFAGQVGADAGKTLPMLNHIMSYPTTIFIDKKGNVRKIYTGINGPATGMEYEKWKDDTVDLVQKLLKE